MYIRLNSITIFAHHGVYEEEIASGNHFEIDLECTVPYSCGTTTDELHDAVDYSQLFSAVIAVSESRRFNLLEAFAHAICNRILEKNQLIENILVKVRKLNPPVGGSVKHVEVELEMRRDA
jgi:dihydroneopterin aldolase